MQLLSTINNSRWLSTNTILDTCMNWLIAIRQDSLPPPNIYDWSIYLKFNIVFMDNLKIGEMHGNGIEYRQDGQAIYIHMEWYDYRLIHILATYIMCTEQPILVLNYWGQKHSDPVTNAPSWPHQIICCAMGYSYQCPPPPRHTISGWWGLVHNQYTSGRMLLLKNYDEMNT